MVLYVEILIKTTRRKHNRNKKKKKPRKMSESIYNLIQRSKIKYLKRFATEESKKGFGVTGNDIVYIVYAMLCTRTNIYYAVSVTSLFQANIRERN